MDPNEVLRRISDALETTTIPYMVVGSFASSYHGAVRSTGDVDIVIDPDSNQLRKFIEYVCAREYYADAEDALEAWRQRSMFNVIDMVTGWKIDLILVKPRRFSRIEFRRRMRVNYEGIPLVLATTEDTVLSKLEWAKLGKSARQLEDVASLIKKNWGLLDHAYMGQWIIELNLASQWTVAKQAAGLE